MNAGAASKTKQPARPALPVAVVGAGITGLTAAFRLRQRGLPVVVFEATARTGGVIRSLRQGGYLAEFGPNSILETSPRITSLIRDAGLEGRRLCSDARADNRYIVRGGQPVCLPLSPVRFFTCRLFSPGAKLRLLVEPFVPRAPADREESVAEFVLRRLNREWLEYAINPLVAGIYAGDPRKLSVKHGFPRLHAVEQQYRSLILGQVLGAKQRKRRGEVSKQEAPKLSFDEGLQVLTDALQASLGDAVRLNAPVIRLAPAPNGWVVTARFAEDNHEEPVACRAVLLAAPAYRLAQLELLGDASLSLAPLERIYYPPVASVVLGFRREEVRHPLDGFGMLIPERERCNILGALFSSSLFPNRAPAGFVTLTSYLGGVRAPDLALRPESELVELTVNDLRNTLGVTGQPTFQHCVLYPKAIPQYEVGYGQFIDLMTSVETRAPGLFFAGHYRDGISLGDSILSAHAVAERIAAFLGQSSA